jgi:serine/threonine-protein kinase
MAELALRLQYSSNVRLALLTTLRVTFPLWGIIAPIAAVMSLLIMITSLNNHYSGYDTDFYMKVLGVLLGSTAVSIGSLLSTRALTNDCITADKDGLVMPFAAGLSRPRISWNTLQVAKVTPPVAPDVRQQTLVLIDKKGRAVSLQLSRLQQSEIEQLLLALEMWAPTCDKDASFLTLQQQIKQIAPNNAEVSYTNMWEEELRRRFCAAAFMPLEPGTGLRNGSLRVVRQLALGGLSALYLCQLDDKQLVVIKEAVVPEDSVESVKAKAQQMFQREAELLMKLNHKNIVKVLDCFMDGGRNYMMLEYVNGQDLRQFVKQNGAQKEHVVVDWAVQIAGILKYLHEQDPPIIHRDLTPDNLVLREDGSIVLIDFGAANEFIGNSTGTFVGKQSFIAPEQFRGKACTQSDLYALGCTLHFLLTGQEPEALSTSTPRDVTPDINEELNDLVVCCTQMEPGDRYQSAAQMLPVLKKMAASLLVS